MGLRRLAIGVLVVLFASWLATAVQAYVEPNEPSRFDRLVVYDPSSALGLVAETPEDLPDFDAGRAAWASFKAAHGAGWQIHVDRRSGTPMLVQGSGVRWFDPASGPASLSALETQARAFLAANAALMKIDGAQIVLDPAGSAAAPERAVLLFNRVVDGLPVEGQRLRFFVNHGQLVAFGADRWTAAARAPEAAITASTARQILYTYMGILPHDQVVERDPGSEVLVAVADAGTEYAAYRGAPGRGATLHRAYRFTLEVAGERGVWTGKVDAVDGSILALYDDVKYAQVKGGVFPLSNDGTGFDSVEQPDFPMPYVSVTVGGVPQAANDMGMFDCQGGGAAATTALTSTYVRIADVCGAVNEGTTCDSDLDLKSGPAGQTNCSVNAGASAGNTHASRSAYYNVSRINERVRHWLPGNAWLSGQVEVDTNVNSTCNASWGGKLNMYRAGGGCGNTAEIAGVLTHEWGHGLDQNDGGGYDDPTEGYADVVALMHLHESCNGRGFDANGGNCGGYGDACLHCTGVRDDDYDAHASHTPATPQGYGTSNCGGGDGPCGREQHCEGVIPGEAMWDLAVRDLPASGLDQATAWHVAEKLWFTSRQGSGGNAYNCALPNSDGCNAGSWFNELRAADDDDGNLANGTPHAAAIFAAFKRHGIACGAAADAANQSTSGCASLAAPAVTAAAGSGSVTLSWAAVPNATAYAILRNDLSCGDAHHVIATVPAPATSYVDDQLANGFAVYYAVHAVGATPACESPLSACQAVTPLPRRGELLLDRGRYDCADVVQIKLRDLDLNKNSAAVETVQVTASSFSETVPETVTLTETGPATSQFTGSIALSGGTVVGGDGILQTSDGDVVTVVYKDADDGTGAPATVAKDAVTDCAGPEISNVRVTDIADDGGIVRWESVEAGSSRVDWGTTASLGNVASDPTLTTTHAVSVRPLAECGKAYFRVSSTDALGNVRTVDAAGAPFTFSAKYIPGLFKDTFETATGWTLEGEWQIQTPAGRGTGPDPAGAFDGTKALGQDLSGLGSHPGDYEVNTTERAVSPVINASSLTAGTLTFRRWLNVTGAASSTIEVKKGGKWNTVWTSPTLTGVAETAWSVQTVDISTYADGNSQLQIAFKQTGGTSATKLRGGWNVDRFIVRSASQPDMASCGGCGAAPSFAGASGALDLAGCGDTGIQVSWPQAVAWGTGGSGTYSVYRDTSPAFTPQPGNRIATGLTGTSYVDAAAPNGIPLYYAVQAENDETCSSGPSNGGVVDGNTVRVQARDDVGQPAPGDVGATLRSDDVNDAHVRLSWAAATGAASYHVLRGAGPQGPFTQIANVTGTSYEDTDEMLGVETRYYVVRAVDSCGNEGP